MQKIQLFFVNIVWLHIKYGSTKSLYPLSYTLIYRTSFERSTLITKLERSIYIYETIWERFPNVVKKGDTLKNFYSMF